MYEITAAFEVYLKNWKNSKIVKSPGDSDTLIALSQHKFSKEGINLVDFGFCRTVVSISSEIYKVHNIQFYHNLWIIFLARHMKSPDFE